MSRQSFRHSFYRQEEVTSPTDLIYDEVYKNASHKNKYSKNPKYMYYNALLSMKQKLSKEQTPVFDCLFNPQPRKMSSPTPIQSSSNKNNLMPIYHVEKINKMKFKIYKQGGSQFIDKMPVQDISFQIKVKGQEHDQTMMNVKPRLEEILSEYRKMNSTKRHAQSRGPQYKRSIGYGSEMNVKQMRKTVYKIGGAGSFRK